MEILRLPLCFALLCWIANVPLQAQAAVSATAPETKTCKTAFDEAGGERITDPNALVIDGATLQSPDDFARATGPRSSGLRIIKGGDFSGWNFQGFSLSFVCFEGSKLAGADLTGAQGFGAAFINADLTGANMQRAVFPEILFRDAKLASVQAKRAMFRGGHFDGGWRFSQMGDRIARPIPVSMS